MFAIYHNIDYTDIANEWNKWNSKKASNVSRKSTRTKPNESKSIEKPSGESKSTEKKSIYIVKHRNNDFFWHPESKFVFDKITKKVIGVYSDDKLMKLNNQDKMICKTYGFKLQS
jgi:hypothetical protein